jgi:hypothetical protein
MYKTAGKFMNRHPGLSKRESDERQFRHPEWAVIWFWRRKGNNGECRVYRYIKIFRIEECAEAFLKGVRKYIYLALISWPEDGILQRVKEIGDYSVVEEWLSARKGVNADADPFTSSSYGLRSLKISEAWGEEEILS